MAVRELERQLEENADADAVSTIRKRIAEEGVEYVYYQFVSINGRVLGKLSPARNLDRNLSRGVHFHGSATADLTSDRHGALIGAGPEAEEFVALPDIGTFEVLPWDPSFGRFLCRLYRRFDRPTDAGEPLPTDARANLERQHDWFRERTGLTLRSGCEPEMTWLGEDLEVESRPGRSPAYHIGALETMRPVAKRVIAYAQAMGLDMIEGDYEDTSQLELNFDFDDCLHTADRLVTYRQICAQVARELGVTATFMPKPLPGVMANGCHHNLSLWRGDENVLVTPGVRELHLSETARHALGGLLEHARGAMAILAPTVNSYVRFWESGLFAPALANWGYDNRTCAVRVSAIGRLEYKLPDASVNPYLSHAVILHSILDGLERGLDPGAPEQGSSYEDEVAEKERFPSLPLTLGDALAAADEDSLIRAALGGELYRVFRACKLDEWERACGAVTDWHRDMYLHALP